jgi:ketosteroid isomerase-like protein
MPSKTEIVQHALAAYGRGNYEAALKDVDEDAEWIIPGNKEEIPYSGTWKGKSAVRDFFDTIKQFISEIKEIKAHEIIEHGNVVILFGHSVTTYKTGKTVTNHWCYRVIFNEASKILQFRVYNDTAAIANALRR